MRSTDPIERRRFIQLLAMTGALAAAQPKTLVSAAERARAPSRAKKSEPPRSAALRKELEAQRKALDDMLRVVRAHRLPAGSPPAFVFQPLRVARGWERT